MKIEITVYKNSGKWYTSEIVENDVDIPMWDEKFKEFIRDNNPADLGNGFIATRTIGDGFHNALWKYSEIY